MLPILRLARHDRPLPYPPKGHVFSLACMVCQAQAILGPIREADRMQQAQYHEQQAAEQVMVQMWEPLVGHPTTADWALEQEAEAVRR